MPVELKGLFLVSQAADLLGVHRTTLHRWLRAGKIQTILIAGQRLIPESEIERLKNEREGTDAKE